jgi:hypothetical protein
MDQATSIPGIQDFRSSLKRKTYYGRYKKVYQRQLLMKRRKEGRKEDGVKARKIIIYSVRDHLLPRISNMKTTYEMYEALKNMFESNNTLRALTLKGRLQNIKMKKGDTIATVFMKMSEIIDQLGAIGEIISTLSGIHLYILFVSLS